MSKIAVISDIHGEVGALELVLDQARSEGISRFWCLGDSLEWLLPRDPLRRGDPEALRRVIAGCEIVLAGNHEWALLDDPLGRERLDQEFDGEALAAKMEVLEPRQRIDGEESVELVHAGLGEPYWEQIETADDVAASFASTDARLILCGHTHRPLAATVNGEEVQFPNPSFDAPMSIASGRWLLNPGSVGRSGDVAIWAVIEFDASGRATTFGWRITPWRPKRIFS